MRKPIINLKGLKKGSLIMPAGGVALFDNMDFGSGDISGSKIEELSLVESRMERVEMNQVKIDECKIEDCVIVRCNFVGAKIEKPYFNRVEISGSRLQGTQFLAPIIKETHFKSCKAVSVGFRYGKLTDVVFEDCDLSEADFTGAELKRVMFKTCTLNRSQFSQAKLSQVSLKGNSIEDITIEKDSFRDVVVDTGQAIYLSSVFGLNIQD